MNASYIAGLPLFAPVRYPNRPGYAPRDTSKAAALAIEPRAPRLAQQILELISRAPHTCFEIETATGLSHQTASARIRELNLKGLITDSGLRRKTGSGRNAIVWRAAA